MDKIDKLRRLRLTDSERLALDRLIATTKSDSGQAAKAAKFLLAWWNSEEFGGFDPATLWSVDQEIAQDMLTCLEMMRRLGSYPDAVGYEEEFKGVVSRWGN